MPTIKTWGFKALGTRWWINADLRGQGVDSLQSTVDQVVSKFEQDYSRFKPDSLISKLNNTPFARKCS